MEELVRFQIVDLLRSATETPQGATVHKDYAPVAVPIAVQLGEFKGSLQGLIDGLRRRSAFDVCLFEQLAHGPTEANVDLVESIGASAS